MNFKSKIVSSSFVLCLFYISCNKPSEQANKVVAAAEGETSVKIVYINIDTLLSKYNLYLDKKSDLEAQSKVAEKSLAGKLEAFRKRAAKFQQDVAEIQQKANTIAPVELKKIEERYGRQQQDLVREEESLMKQRDNSALDLDKQLQATQKDLQEKIDVFLSKVADEKGYDLVLMKGSTGSVMYGRNTIDITDDTVKRLNEEYASSKAAPEKK
ncbi:MAG: OmpH family outer membrane protein [Saprospiraceae bacterium]|jgi:outer membrane protein|nr:OmpH family outer membrane protein [Saprospiraceae bacterium]MBL0026076.1 OmpH family outer membrane protein [Saprospiraceae bacterium]